MALYPRTLHCRRCGNLTSNVSVAFARLYKKTARKYFKIENYCDSTFINRPSLYYLEIAVTLPDNYDFRWLYR
jgi:hypothetical protein